MFVLGFSNFEKSTEIRSENFSLPERFTSIEVRCSGFFICQIFKVSKNKIEGTSI